MPLSNITTKKIAGIEHNQVENRFEPDIIKIASLERPSKMRMAARCKKFKTNVN